MAVFRPSTDGALRYDREMNSQRQTAPPVSRLAWFRQSMATTRNVVPPATAVPVDERGVRAAWTRLCATWTRLSLIGPVLNARYHLRHANRLGQRVTLRGRPKVVNQGTMTFGERVGLDSTVATLELVTYPGGHLEIGENVFINYGSSLVASAHVKVGDGCLIGTHVMVMDCDFHRVEDKAWDITGRPVILEDRVWLGNRSIVLKGVTIGHDAVVGAGSVVTRDVPPRSVVAGSPARVMRTF